MADSNYYYTTVRYFTFEFTCFIVQLHLRDECYTYDMLYVYRFNFTRKDLNKTTIMCLQREQPPVVQA